MIGFVCTPWESKSVPVVFDINVTTYGSKHRKYKHMLENTFISLEWAINMFIQTNYL